MPLTPPQAEIYIHEARNRVVVCGRRFGKSTLACNELIRAAQSGDSRNVWYVCPTYKMAKRIMWKMLNAAIPKANIQSSNITDLEITLKGYNSTICLKGCEDPDALRGDALDFLVVDETQDVDYGAITTVLAPALADRKGEALYIGTAKGRGSNTLYQLYLKGKKLANWKSWRFTSREGGNIDDEELDALRASMSNTEFRQEMEASFEAVQGRCFYNFEPDVTITDKALDNGGQLLVGMDFNVSFMTAIIGVKVGSQLHLIDEIAIENANTRMMCQELQDRYPGRDIVCFPDPSCKSRKTSAEVGQTDLSIISDKKYGFGFSCIAPRRAPLIVDSLNEVNALLLDANGNRNMYVHPRCEHAIDSLDGLLYKEGTTQPDKNSGLDHFADCIRYLVHSKFSMRNTSIGTLEIDYNY